MRSKAIYATIRSWCCRNRLSGFKDLDSKIDEKCHFRRGFSIKNKRNSKADQMKANIVHYKKGIQK